MKKTNFSFLLVALLLCINNVVGQQLMNLPANNNRFTITDITWPANVGDAEVCLWNDDKVAAVTLTIDDNIEGEHSWWLAQSALYPDFTFTWFINSGNGSANWPAWQAIVNAGHEVQAHDNILANDPYLLSLTGDGEVRHCDINLADDQFYHDTYDNYNDIIEAQLGNRVSVMAYPCGIGREAAIDDIYIACRGTHGEMNKANGTNYLNTESRSGKRPDIIEGWVTNDINYLLDPSYELWNKVFYRGWASYHFHTLNNLSVGDMRPATAAFLSKLNDNQDVLWIGGFPQVAMYGQERDSHTLTVTSASSSLITFNLTDQMNDTYFDFPLTVKIRVDNSWDGVSAIQNGSPVEATLVTNGGNKYALVKAVPDRGEVSVTSGGGIYYCDPVNGNMTSNDGSQGSPWSTLEEVFAAGKTFQAGDIIYLLSGNHGAVTIQGTNSDNVTITAAPGASPEVDYIKFVSASKWVVSNLEFSPDFDPVSGANYFVFMDINSSYNTIDNCTMYSVFDLNSATEWNTKAWSGFDINGPNNTITNNDLQNIRWGFRVDYTATNTTGDYNTITNLSYDGIQSLASYCTYQYNIIKNVYELDGNHDDFFQCYSYDGSNVGTTTVYGVVLRGNTFISFTDPNQYDKSDCQGIGNFDGMYEDWVVENNVIITDMWHGITFLGAVNCKIVNNTVVKNPIDAHGLTPWIMVDEHKNGTPSSGCIISNNLASDFDLGNAGSGTINTNNLQTTDYATNFVDYANFDVHLKAGSAALDAGTSNNAPAIDIEGTARPQNSGFDIGAYEYSGTAFPVTGVSVSPTSLTLIEDQSADLTENVQPANASNPSVSWTTSDPAIATVDANGLVKGIASGSCTITATTNEGGFTANCTVTVNAYGVNLALNKSITVSAYQDDAGGTYPGANLVDGDVSDDARWSASGFPQWAEIDLGTNYDLAQIKLYPFQNRAYQYIIEGKPDGGSYSTIVDRSSNTESADVLIDNVTGTARYIKITVSALSGSTSTWVSLAELKVYAQSSTVPVTGVSLSPTTLTLDEGQTSDLTETVSPANATDQSVTWSSSNTSVATVSSSGLVTAVSAGSATITVTTDDGSFTANCSVTVNAVTGLPSPWTSNDIGSVAATGSATYSGGTFTVEGSGSNIWNTADEFHFVYQQVTDDATIIARITSITNPHQWTKGGVMMRETLNSNSINGHTFLAPIASNGSKFSYRTTTGATSSEFDGPNVTAPYWLRMERSGNTFTGSVSVDGSNWTTLGSTTIDMSSTYYVGLCVSSLVDGTLATGTFNNVSVTGSTIPVTGVSVSPTTLTLDEGETSDLTETVSPASATDKSVIWSSSNTSVATVSSSGLVTAVSAGSATITVTTNDGSFTANCTVTVNIPVVPVTGVSVSPTTLTLDEGQTSDLTETVSPANATDQSVIWSSNNTSVATVSSSGLVTAVSAGSATITVTTNDGSFTANCTVTVNVPVVPVTGVSVSPTTLTLDEGQTSDLTETVNPANATDQSVTWSSNNTSVATVSSSGLVTAVSAGSTTITVTTNDGSFTANCSVTVNAVTGLPSPWTSNDIGSVAATGSATYSGGTFTVEGSGSNIWNTADEFHFVYQQVTDDATIIARITSITNPHQWTKGGVMMRETLNSNSINGHTFLAPIASNGSKFSYRTTTGATSSEFDGPNVTAPYWLRMERSGNTFTGSVSVDGSNWTTLGSTTINMSSTYYVGLCVSSLVDGTLATGTFDNVSVTTTSTVPVTGVSVLPVALTLDEGQTSDLTETVSPANATDKSVTWSSNNTSIATVDANGLVTAISAGSATITVTTNDGSFTANCAVTVNVPVIPVTGVTVSPTTLTLDEGQTSGLIETVSPANATDQSVIWSSSNTSVATVDANGLVTAVSAGSATITVTTNDGSYTATCAAIVNAVSIINLALNKSITVSAYQDDAYGFKPGENLVDGDVSDDARWSASGFPQWAEIDLGADYALTQISLYPYQDRAYQYIVEAKPAGGSYSTIVNRSSNTESADVLSDNVSATARYIKITVSGLSGNASTWVSLSELEVYGATSGGGSDTQSPSVPTGLASSSITQTSFTLSWAASTDNVGVTSYEVFKDGASIGTTTTTSMSVSGLTASTSYSMTVRAGDAAGNWSAQSSALNVTTLTATDTQAPSVPTALTSGSVAQTSFTLSWTASTDNVGVTNYEVFEDGVSIGTATGTSMSVTGLTASTTYSMTVRAGDAAGNWSVQSSVLNVTTLVSSGDDWPTLATTGTSGTLTSYSGDITTTSNGQLIENLDISGSIHVVNSNVTIRNCKFAALDIKTTTSTTGENCLLEDCELGWAGRQNFTMRRCQMIGQSADLVRVSGPNVTIEDSYLHLTGPRIDSDHSDCIQEYPEGFGTNLTIRHNRMYNEMTQTSIVIDASDMIFEDNLVAGGAYCIYAEPGSSLINNHFSTIFYAAGGRYGIINGTIGTCSGNVWHETGEPINCGSSGEISLTKIVEPSIEIYPNPLNGNVLNINLEGYESEEVNIKITDLTGRSVYNQLHEAQSLLNISAGMLNKGIYIISINGKQQKLVVE